MEIRSSSSPKDRFERETLDLLAQCALPGIAINNVILPHNSAHPAFYRLPNEHDILVCLDGHIYTLDMKALNPGWYRGSDAEVEYSPDGCLWKPLPDRLNPYPTAFKKGRVLEAYMLGQLRGMGVPQFVSAIVVPDHADVTGLAAPTGHTQRGARLLLTPLHQLCSVLAADAAASRQRTPVAADLAAVLQAHVSDFAKALPCWVNEYVRVDASIGQPRRPLLRDAYRGTDRSRRNTPVRVEIMRQFKGDHAATELQRAFRANLTSLSRLHHESILKHYSEFEAHSAFVLVGEYFSETTLETMRHSLPTGWVLPIFQEVVSALRHAHRRDIVHRFVAPSCILVRGLPEQRPEVRVGGFFGAAVAGQSAVAPAPPDDPYQAPEHSDETQWRTPMEDAWAVGRCLCEALTGDPRRLPSAGLPPGIVQLIPLLLESEPEARRTAWDGLAHMLGAP
jgi:hypothetical protein